MTCMPIRLLFALLLVGTTVIRTAAQDMRVVDSVKKRIASAPTDTARVEHMIALARAYEQANPKTSYSILQQSVVISKRVGYTRGYANASLRMASIDDDMHNNTAALEHCMQAANAFRMIGDSEMLYDAYYLVVLIFQARSDNEHALKYGIECISYYERTGNDRLLAGLYHNLSSSYGSVGNTAEQTSLLKKALRINQRIGNRSWAARNMLALATNMEDQNWKESLSLHQQALVLARDSHDSSMIGMALVGTAVIRTKQRAFQEATDSLMKALRVFRNIRDVNGVAWTFNNLGHAYTLQRRFAEATVCLDSCLRLCRLLKSTGAMRNVYLRLYQLDSASGNYASAYTNYRNYIAANDSLNSADNIRSAMNQVMRHQYALREAAARTEQEKKDITQRNIRNSIAAGVVLALGFLVVVYRQRNRVEREKKRSESLLLNILPAEVASELMTRGETSARRYDNVTVLFTDFVDFTKIGEGMRPEDLVQELHECFSAFDAIIERNGLEKIKTTGDAYMAVCGMPAANEHHAEACVRAALEILAYVHHRTQQGKAFQIRIGIHSGSVVAGIVGVKKFAYDIWGDVVNTAARMEQHSMPGKITISESTYQLVHDRFICTPRGKVAVKGKGEMEMYFVEETEEESRIKDQRSNT